MKEGMNVLWGRMGSEKRYHLSAVWEELGLGSGWEVPGAEERSHLNLEKASWGRWPGGDRRCRTRHSGRSRESVYAPGAAGEKAQS